MARFHVRARTVDMLGRQQIAGIPTAISELFKNAHDAYARTVEADYFRAEDLLVLRDDGLGMTKQDFESRWLTLGTDSKLGTVAGLPPPPRDPAQKKRPILGEKGIGRLAVAILGPQLLILSRARRQGKASESLVAAYLNWNLFAQPGLDLDEIEIPVREFPADRLPGREAVKEMIDEFARGVELLKGRVSEGVIQTVEQELEAFEVDPAELDDDLGSPTLLGDGAGTHFFIQPVDDIIQEDIDTRGDLNQATRFEKHLLGFTNTMTSQFKPPPIIARFRDYPDEGAPVELIGDAAFFTPDEYKEVDHQIVGKFDEYGQFRGSVGIYQTEPDPYVLNWSESDGRKTLCGPFKFSVAVIQGQDKDFLLAPEEFARMVRKANRHGGIYIYRDGVRVQPYGDSDYDWLDIERRRTLGAGYYFYSFRRMFGAIELSSSENNALKEKAGREGFIENRAYREFRSILVNFFLQSAADFFREEGRRADEWEQTRAQLQKSHHIRRQRARRVSAKKREFRNNLDTFFEKLQRDEFGREAERTIKATKEKCNRILRSRRRDSEKALALMRVEKEGRKALDEIRKQVSVSKPRGVGLPRVLMNQWFAYVEEANKIEHNIIGRIEEEIEEYISNSAVSAKVPLRHFARIDAAVRSRTGSAIGTVRKLRRESDASVSQVSKLAQSTAKSSFKAVNVMVEEVVEELEMLKRAGVDAPVLTEKREELIEKIDLVFEREREALEALKEQFDALGRIWSKDGFGGLELTEALEEELEELKSQRDLDLEMAQIGMAVNIVSHEFEKTVSTLRQGFRRMGAWADANPDLAGLYKSMRGAFEHLDAYLVLFTPLDRRLHPVKVNISGNEIYEFLFDLFERRLSRHRITLSATKKFREFELEGFPSTFYPVFANLVDNAIFWLQQIRERPRTIELEVKGQTLLVSDNGPGVSKRDAENIFLPRFSRKPGGRGMGLHVSKATLGREGYDLRLGGNESVSVQGAVFAIEKKDENL